MSATLSCPNCILSLDREFRCERCEQSYPVLGGVPFLYEDTEAKIAKWIACLGFEIQELDRSIQKLQNEVKAGGHGDATRSRLRALIDGRMQNRAQILKVLEPMGFEIKGSIDSKRSLVSHLPKSHSLFGYIDNLFRDWVWGEEENQVSLELVNRALSEEAEQIAVMGSGFGRLAFDLAWTRPKVQIHSLEVNPLSAFFQQNLKSQEILEMVEFPLAPLRLNDVAIKQKISANRRCDNLNIIVGDALHPPYENESLDAIVLPWFLDVCGTETKEVFLRLNRVLRPGGTLLHFGPLGFDRKNEADNLTIEEVIERAERAGFKVQTSEDHRIPYLSSPYSGQNRLEKVSVLGFEKIASKASPPPHRHLPEWIYDPSLPVPRYVEFEHAGRGYQSMLQLVSLIDGKRSLKQVSEIHAKKTGMDPNQMQSIVLEFFVDFIESKL